MILIFCLKNPRIVGGCHVCNFNAFFSREISLGEEMALRSIGKGREFCPKTAFHQVPKDNKLCCQLKTFLLQQIRNGHSRKQNYFNFKAKRIILFNFLLQSTCTGFNRAVMTKCQTYTICRMRSKSDTSQKFLQLTELPEKPQVLVLTDCAHLIDQMLNLNCPENPRVTQPSPLPVKEG